MAPRKASDRNPRATRACARCRKRKIKCDLVYPRCGTCAAVGIECIGFNSATGEEQPRSLVSFLEKRVAKLELEIASLQSQSIAATTSSAEEDAESEYRKLREDLVGALTLTNGLDDTNPTSDNSRIWCSTSYLTSSPLPTSRSRGLCRMKTDSWSSTLISQQKRDIASIPRNVLDIMLKHYSETYLVQYPVLGEAELIERCNRVCDKNGSAFDNYVVCMALSISAHTLIHHDQIRATKAADDFWESAIMHLDAIWQQSLLTQLQAIMLLCHYGFVNPSAANSVACSQAAMALCIQLGLHREPTPENIQCQIDVKSQRRIFWTCYAMNAQNQMLMTKAFDIDQIRLSVQYPTVPTTSTAQSARVATANYLSAFRKLESEITMGLFHPQSCDAEVAAPGWLDDVRARTKLWREQLESQEFASKVEFREVMFQYQRLRLSRPSPRFPVPCFSKRRESIAAGTFLATHYNRVMRQGGFFYWHHASWHLFEIGIVLADAANTGLDLVWRRQESFLKPNGAVEITGALRSIPMILRWMKHRWPQIEAVAVETDQIFVPVLDRLDKWINGVITPPIHDAQICAAIKVYLLGADWKQLENATFEDDSSIHSPVSRRNPGSESEHMTMEEVFRVLQPNASLPEVHSRFHPPNGPVSEDMIIPELNSFDPMPNSNGFPQAENSYFWHGGGFELEDLFSGFNAGGFY